MPAKDQLDPNSVRTRVRVWLAMHPGWHTSRDVAAGVGITDAAGRTALVRALNRLADRGEGVTSYRPPGAPSRGPGTVYAQAGTRPPATV